MSLRKGREGRRRKMGLMNKGKEEQLYVSCEIGDDTREKIKEVRKMKGKRTGWLIKKAIEEFIDGSIVI